MQLEPRENSEFQLRGINHLALVCKDMKRTVDFYTEVLGMPLVKTIELPGGMGQHFFFDIGNGDSLAFFWFPDAPQRAPGIASPAAAPGIGQEITTAHGSMNHVAFDVPEERFEEYHAKLVAEGHRCHADHQPRRQPARRGQGDGSRRFRAFHVLHGPGRHPARIRLLDARV